jgi:hypothetical protein
LPRHHRSDVFVFVGYVTNTHLPVAEDDIPEPFLMGCARESVIRRIGSVLFPFVCVHAPKIYFRPAEQRLFLPALRGFTDEQLSDELCISLKAVSVEIKLTDYLVLQQRRVHLVAAESLQLTAK